MNVGAESKVLNLVDVNGLWSLLLENVTMDIELD